MENDVYRARPRKRKTWIFPVLLFVGIYMFLQAYLMNANGVDTVKAVHGYINDSIISQGIICRDEVVLTRNSNGVVDYLAEDGERISQGHLIGNVYSSHSDIRNLAYLRNRQSMLDDIYAAESFLDNGTVDMSVTRKQLSSQLSDLSALSAVSDYQNINDNLAQLTLVLNKISVATGRTTEFNSAESQLKSEISAANSAIGNVQDSLYSSHTGYFLQNADGYENVATVDNFLRLSYEEGKRIISSESNYSPQDNVYGKIVTDYRWSVCTYIDTEQAKNLYEGRNISISINVKENEFHKATVEHLVEMGEKTLVVIECSDMNPQAVKNRITDCEILFKQYKGIKIPKTALRFDGEQMGVYVNFSNLVQFKKITPVYEDDSYVVVPLETDADNQVKLYDSIIVKGRNLYDGKYL